jgi:hypothetical protein
MQNSSDHAGSQAMDKLWAHMRDRSREHGEHEGSHHLLATIVTTAYSNHFE